MGTLTQTDYDRLHDYLCDVVLEEQIKLGYEKETIRFYSPSASIANILHLTDKSSKAVIQALEPFCAHVSDTLGTIEISKCSDERICFLIPAKGAEYVHENWDKNPFLEELIACFLKHAITLEDVRRVFEKWSDTAECIHIGSDEFDDVLYFADGKPDAYRYCVKFDAGHAFYHRFLKEDYEDLLKS